MEQILVGGCSNICNEVQEQKLGQAYRVATGEAEEGEDNSINYIESPYSQRSFVDYKDNIYSIKNSLYGTRDIDATTPNEHSIMSYLKTNNAELATKMDDAIKAALQSFDDATAAQGYFKKAPGSPAVANCIEKVKACDDVLNEVGTWFTKQETK